MRLRPGYAPVAGAIGGLVATVAMTAVMQALYRRLPRQERYPLPPRELVDSMLPPISGEEPNDDERRVLALGAHAAYGAAAGALYACIVRRPGAIRGATYGVAVWAASYLCWIPALRLLKPATSHPPRRNALMVVAHLVWGGVLGGFLRGRRQRHNAVNAANQAPGFGKPAALAGIGRAHVHARF